MARMYSGKRGKAGSKKPAKDKPLSWITYTPQEVEQLIIKLAKAEKAQSQIGTILRDSYGIPDVQKITQKKIGTILKEHKVNPELPEDLTSLIKRQTLLTRHIEKNKNDMTSRRGLLLTNSKIHRLTKYYQRKGVLPKGWTYTTEEAKYLSS
ncbi:30S ribosomal protein S15 [Candidatus Woesearchaeota archaeon]|nr:30S ribosomal protein S15 [Candidatus Woesearchaeota archaeon]